MKKAIFIWIVFVLVSCEKDPVIPEGMGNFVGVQTIAISNIQDTRALSGVTIANVSPQYSIQERGVCWGMADSPTVSDFLILTNANTPSVNLTDLIPGQKYFVRSYAKINGIYTYGNQREFMTTATNSALSNGLVAYYPLNGDSKDYSSSGNTLSNGATKAIGRSGVNNTAYSFNGTSQFLTLLNPKNLPANNAPYSMSMWFKANIWSRDMVIAGYGPANVPAACNYAKTLATRGLMHNHWSFDQTFSTGTFTNSWMHLVISYDGGTERYYLNGQLVYSWPHPTSPLLINPIVLSIGARVVNASSNDVREYFSGSIDELRVYNRAISASEASSLFNL
jgi:hypothetical protein